MRLRFGDFVLDRGARQLQRGREERHLGPKAFDLLELLLARRPNVVSKESIRDQLWPGTFIAGSTLATVVAELREALEDDPKQPRFLRTVHGVGYAFSGDVRESASDERDATAVLVAEAQRATTPVLPEATPVSDTAIEPKDAALPSTDVASSRREASGAALRASRRRRELVWGALVLASAIVVAGALWQNQLRSHPPMRGLTIPAPEGANFADDNYGYQQLAISSDGRRVAFGGLLGPYPSHPGIFLRDAGETESTSMAEWAHTPFFSPDGRWIGFIGASSRGLALLKAPIGGGPAESICPFPGYSAKGATWLADGTIVFTPSADSGLWRVASIGGTPRKLNELLPGETSHRWPQGLPGGRAVLFTAVRGPLARDAGLEAVVLETGERRRLIEGSGFGRYSPTGHLVFAQSGKLLAAPFDVDALEVTGAAVPVVDGVRMNFEGSLYAEFDIAPSGGLVYMPGSLKTEPRALLWVDRSGSTQPVQEGKGAFSRPQISPDGRQLLVNVWNDREIGSPWLLDLESGKWRLVPSDGRGDRRVWSPDGRYLAHLQHQGANNQLYLIPVDLKWASSPKGPRFSPTGAQLEGWSRDGLFMIFGAQRPIMDYDIGLRQVDGGETRWLVSTPALECCAALSPNGLWMAYVATDDVGYSVYVTSPSNSVTSISNPSDRYRVSTNGGVQVRWSRDGRELYYRTLGDRRKLMAVPVDVSGGRPKFGVPRALFDDTFFLDTPFKTAYDVAADGRFVFIDGLPTAGEAHELVLIPDFGGVVRARVASR
jgi:eukaryotic-like serine/threonine-protein kinase